MSKVKTKKIYQKEARLVKNTKVATSYYKIVFDVPQIAKNALPGQFINIKVNDKYAPLLRRPFSIHRVSGSKIEILYEVIGEGTKVLSRKKAGTKPNILGPLGNGFNLDSKKSDKKAVLVAGGMGIAPLVFLAEKLKSKAEVFIGGKTKKQILCEEELKKLGCDVKIATDDGSLGFKGLVTNLLKKRLREKNKPLMIFSCGPKAMLREIANISKKYKIPAQISLEEHMACGIGACFGCSVETRFGYKRVCKEGPVFDARDIKF